MTGCVVCGCQFAHNLEGYTCFDCALKKSREREKNDALADMIRIIQKHEIKKG